ncbi:hypothetical protein D3C78_1389860 [compost metagenome]
MAVAPLDLLFAEQGLAIVAHPDLVQVGIGILAAHERTALVGGGYPPGLATDGQVHPLAVFLAEHLLRVLDMEGDIAHVVGRGEEHGEPVAFGVVLLQVGEGPHPGIALLVVQDQRHLRYEAVAVVPLAGLTDDFVGAGRLGLSNRAGGDERGQGESLEYRQHG